MKAFLRQPWLHFLLLGGVLLWADRALERHGYGAGQAPIHLSARQVENLRQTWEQQTGQAPSDVQLQAGLRRIADEEILLREARRLDLNRTDIVVRGRLLKNLQFAFPDVAASEDERLRQALALGMDTQDMVVRRRLLQLMEERLSAGASVSEAELQAQVQAHPNRYAVPMRVSFHQIFLDAGRRGPRLPDDAVQFQARLASGVDQATAAAAIDGDPFLAGQRFEGVTESDTAKLFGPEFARQLMALAATPPDGRWRGPLASVYGLHFVRMDAVAPAQQADIDAVRARVTYVVLEQNERRQFRQALAQLRHDNPVDVDGVVVP